MVQMAAQYASALQHAPLVQESKDSSCNYWTELTEPRLADQRFSMVMGSMNRCQNKQSELSAGWVYHSMQAWHAKLAAGKQ